MILADKIINERKKNGWSQEELADKLSVSRQAVSKWESAQSVPDLQRVIQMAELFGVSTDYLLKEEFDVPAIVETSVNDMHKDGVVRTVSMEEANEFMNLKQKSSTKIARGVVTCILSPALLVVLASLTEKPGFLLSEGAASGIGVVALLLMVASAVYTFITTGTKLEEYEYLEKEEIETAYGVTGIVKTRKKEFQDTFTRGIAIGVILCILSVIPLITAGLLEAPDYVCGILVAVLLMIVSAGVYSIINVGIIMGSYNILLQEGDYSVESKAAAKKGSPLATIYWSLVTAIYLGWSFWTHQWVTTWIIWPVAGVLFGAVSGIAKCIARD